MHACAFIVFARVREKMAESCNKNTTNTTKKPDDIAKPNRFAWSIKMIENMLESLYEYKTQMDYQNADFNADKAKQYEAVRKILARKYAEDNSLFGPVEIQPIGDKENQEGYKKRCESDKAKIRKGYSRIQEKIKSLRQKFSIAVTSGCRSGSGKLVMEFYDILVKIWGGAPATEPLSFGVQSAKTTESQIEAELLDYDEQSFLEDETTQDSSLLDVDDDDENNPVTGCSNRKRTLNMVPVLIDNKRKHMERQLSAAQRDKILLQESKDEKEFRGELSKSLKESNALFAESMKAMSGSMAALASAMQKSFEHSARSSYVPSAPQVHQGTNYIYQPPVPVGQHFFRQQNVYDEGNDENQHSQSYFKL